MYNSHLHGRFQFPSTSIPTNNGGEDLTNMVNTGIIPAIKNDLFAPKQTKNHSEYNNNPSNSSIFSLKLVPKNQQKQMIKDTRKSTSFFKTHMLAIKESFTKIIKSISPTFSPGRKP